MTSRLALEFIEWCTTARDADAIRLRLFSETQALGYAYVACCSHVDPRKPPPGAVTMINYPATWVDRFSEENFAKRDPIFEAAKVSAIPFHWGEYFRARHLQRDQKIILAEAAEVGLANGQTFPLHAPGALPASCSFVPGPDAVDPLVMPDIFLMAVYAHDAARMRLGGVAPKPAMLTPRERECLILAGRGKSDWAIGEILKISGRTAHNTIERAKRRYGVAFRIQAVVKAVLDGQLGVDDLSDR